MVQRGMGLLALTHPALRRCFIARERPAVIPPPVIALWRPAFSLQLAQSRSPCGCGGRPARCSKGRGGRRWSRRRCSLAEGVTAGADGALGLTGEKRGAQAGQLLMGLRPAEALGGLDHGGPVQRRAMAASRRRFAFRQIRRMVLFMFSMMLVQANDRCYLVGSPRQVTVRISSRPSRTLADTPGASRSSWRARLRTSLSALPTSPISQAWRCCFGAGRA